MPGVNHPPSEFVLQLIGELQKQVRAISTQQQLTFTDSLGRSVVQLGLIPGSSPPLYGVGILEPTSGQLMIIIGERNGSVGFQMNATSNGKTVLYMGQDSLKDGSGRTQESLYLYRDDGTPALIMADLGTASNHPHQQALAWFDRAGNTVIADDTESGVGVARPHIPVYAMQNTNPATWPSTSATTMTQIALSYIEYQQPKLAWSIECYAPAGVTGEFQLQVGGTTVGTTTVVGGTSGTFAMWGDTQPIPSGFSFGGLYAVALNAQVTAGAGTVSAQPYLLQGQGT